MDILNAYLIVDTSCWQQSLFAFSLFPIIVGGVFFGLNLIFAGLNRSQKHLKIAAVFAIIAIAGVLVATWAWDDVPLRLRYEILWRDDSQAFQIDPQEYKFIEQRGDIIVIEENEPVCTRGEYNDKNEW